METNRAIDFSVGMFILIGLIAMLALVAQTIGRGPLNAADSYLIEARFGQVGDLKVHSPVSIAGVTVGRVESIVADPVDFQAIVTLRIDSRFDTLPMDTAAVIESSGLLGGKHIALEPGGDDQVLGQNDQIMLTQSAISLEHLIGKYMLNSGSEK